MIVKVNPEPKEWPLLLHEKMNDWIREAFDGVAWHVETLRHNTDEMKKEIKQLKDKMK
jgi:hypothetical protein